MVAWCVGLSSNNITAMALVTQNLNDTPRCPLGGVTEVGPAFKSNKGFGDLPRGVSEEVHIKSQFYRWGFLWVDDKITIRIVAIAEQFRCKRQAVVKAHTK